MEYRYTDRIFVCLWSVFMDDEKGTQAFSCGKEYKEVIPNECPVAQAGSQVCLLDDTMDMHFVDKEQSKWFIDHFMERKQKTK